MEESECDGFRERRSGRFFKKNSFRRLQRERGLIYRRKCMAERCTQEWSILDDKSFTSQPSFSSTLCRSRRFVKLLYPSLYGRWTFIQCRPHHVVRRAGKPSSKHPVLAAHPIIGMQKEINGQNRQLSFFSFWENNMNGSSIAPRLSLSGANLVPLCRLHISSHTSPSLAHCHLRRWNSRASSLAIYRTVTSKGRERTWAPSIS